MGHPSRTVHPSDRRGWSPLATVALVLALVAAEVAVVAAPVVAAAEPLVPLAGSTVPLDPSISRTPQPRSEDHAPISVTVTLRRHDEAGFQRFLAAVGVPSSPEHAHRLTQVQLADRFGPTRDDYRAVEAWLRDQGFSVVGSANRLTLTATGTRAEAAHAFAVTFSDASVDGRTVRVNDEAPSLPADLAKSVLAVSGLDDLSTPAAIPGGSRSTAGGGASTGAPAAAGNLFIKNFPWKDKAAAEEYCRQYALNNFGGTTSGADVLTFVFFGVLCVFFESWAGQKQGDCMDQIVNHESLSLQQKYDYCKNRLQFGDPPEKIGLLEYDTFQPSDVSDWLALVHGDPSLISKVSKVDVGGGVAAPGAGSSEVLLDIDTILAIDQYSPADQIVVYDAPPSTSFETLFNTMLNDGDTVISNSWSQCEDQTSPAEAQAIDSILAQAQAGGVGVFNATGDTGSTCLDGHANTVGVPADSPHAVAVGGSSLNLGTGFGYGSERYWNDSATPAGGSSGFGVSTIFARPSFQDGLTGAGGRSVPDVVVPAAPGGGMMICQAAAGGCPDGLLYGGTSMAAPEMAVLTTDLEQVIGSNLVDPIGSLYTAAKTNPASFHGPAVLQSDFAHVGLGSPSFDLLLATLKGQSVGPVSVAQSHGFGLFPAAADGTATGEVRVSLADANSYPVAGKTVTLTPTNSATAQVVSATGPSDSSGGSVGFKVTDTVPETVNFTVRDATDGLDLSAPATLTFLPRVAATSSIVASPTVVQNDGTHHTTVSVYLEDGAAHPAAGKTVSLASGGGSPRITPATAVTAANGIATFTVTDTTQESVALSATDVTDGNLPVPGAATVSFQADTGATCTVANPTAAPGFTVSSFATGFPQNQQTQITNVGGLTFTQGACFGVETPAFDAHGTAYVPDSSSGQIFTFGPAGGVAGPPTALPGARFLGGGQLGGLAFGKDGRLYAGLNNTDGNFNLPQLVELDPRTGAVLRVVLTAAQGMPKCPLYIATDPLSGDVFATDDCGGALYSPILTRIKDPASSQPSAVNYATTGVGVGFTFDPAGTIYVTDLDHVSVVKVAGTDQPTATVTTIKTVTDPVFGLSVGAVDGQGHATSLFASDTKGTITRINLTDPVTTTPVATGQGKQQILTASVLGPDGCAYVGDGDRLLKVSGTCSGPVSTTPALTLTGPAATHPATGTPQVFTAKLTHVSNPAGAAIVFAVRGANPQVKLVRADATGTATFTDGGVRAGTDIVVATTVVNGADLGSNQSVVTWVAGKDTTYTLLQAGQEVGPLGQPATIRASVTDLTKIPAAPLGGASVHVAVGAASCDLVTASNGSGSCQVTPNVAGVQPVTATYAGDSVHLASTGTDELVAGGPSTASPPKVSAGAAHVVRPASGTTPIVFTLTLDHASSKAETVHYRTVDGTALASIDYTATSGTATIPVGQTTTTVSVPVIGNRSDDPDKTFGLELTSPTTLVISGAPGVGTIQANHLLDGCPASPTADQRYICHLYLDALGRPAEPGGFAYWTHLLATGTPRLKLATSYLATPEARNVLVDRLYVIFLNRHGDPGGVSYWADKLLAGATPGNIRVSLVVSDEFWADAGGTSTGFVSLLYQDLFHRPVDPGGLSYWRNRIDTGTSRAAVVRSFLGTGEAHTNIVQDIELRFVHRLPTASETSALLAQLAGKGEISVYDQVASSDAAYNRP